jgi:hypothetical protein
MKSQLCAAMVILFALAPPARADGPMGYMKTYGPAADPATRLNWGLLIISLLVTAIIGFLVLYAALRTRPPVRPGGRRGMPPVQPDTGGTSWFYIGVGI